MDRGGASWFSGALPVELWQHIFAQVAPDQQLKVLTGLRAASKVSKDLANQLTTRLWVKQTAWPHNPARTVAQFPHLEAITFDVNITDISQLQNVWQPELYIQLVDEGLSKKTIKSVEWWCDGNHFSLWLPMVCIVQLLNCCPTIENLVLPLSLSDGYAGGGTSYDARERGLLLETAMIRSLPTGLTSLKLWHLELPAAVENLSRLTKLTRLVLDRFHYGITSLEGNGLPLTVALTGLQGLRHLELSFEDEEVDLHEVLALVAGTSTRLRTLKISHVHCFKAVQQPGSVLSPLANIPHLEVLHLSETEYHVGWDDENVLQLSSTNLEVLHGLSSLQELGLGLKMSAPPVDAPAGGASLPALQSAVLDGWWWLEGIEERLLQSLLTLLPSTRLQSLHFTNIPSRQEAAVSLAALSRFSNLKELKVTSRYDQADEALLDAPLSAWASTLSALQLLSINNIDQVPMPLVSGVGFSRMAAGFPSLRELHLQQLSTVTPAVLHMLAFKPSLRVLTCKKCDKVAPSDAEGLSALRSGFSSHDCSVLVVS